MYAAVLNMIDIYQTQICVNQNDVLTGCFWPNLLLERKRLPVS